MKAQLEALLKIGDVSRQTELFSKAQSSYAQALRLIKSTARSESFYRQKIQDASLGEALCLRANAQYSEALKRFRRCLTFYVRYHDIEGQAYVLWAMGTTERFAGRFKNSLKYLKRSSGLYRQLNDKDGLAYTLCATGGCLRMMGRAKESLQCYRRANRYFKGIGDRFGVAYSYCGQSNALRMQNNLSAAWPLMKQAERLYRGLRLKSPLGFVLWSQAQVKLITGDWKAAQQALKDAQRLFTAAQDQRGLVYVCLGFSELGRLKNKSSYKFKSKVAAIMSKRLGLPFEQAHALRFSHPKQASKIYRRCGVSDGFFTYKTLP